MLLAGCVSPLGTAPDATSPPARLKLINATHYTWRIGVHPTAGAAAQVVLLTAHETRAVDCAAGVSTIDQARLGTDGAVAETRQLIVSLEPGAVYDWSLETVLSANADGVLP